jgi:hypothetical protein
MVFAVFRRLLQGIVEACRLAVMTGLALTGLATVSMAQVPGAPMQFMLVHADSGSGNCRPEGCMDWIAAEGMIDARSPGDLRKLLTSIGNRKLPIIVNSPGGKCSGSDGNG